MKKKEKREKIGSSRNLAKRRGKKKLNPKKNEKYIIFLSLSALDSFEFLLFSRENIK